MRRSSSRSVFEPPSATEQFLIAPIKFLTGRIHRLFLYLQGQNYTTSLQQHTIRVVCISDTHCNTQSIPKGDLLIHAGDLTNEGTVDEIQAQIDWLKSLPHQKVVIAGNHDGYFDPISRKREDQEKRLDWGDIHYLERSAIALNFPSCGNRQLHIYGDPRIPRCGGSNFAFQYDREQNTWAGTVPVETDILVTHAPPKFHLDLPAAVGSEELLSEIWRVKPMLHVFGHAHEGYGREKVYWDQLQVVYERAVAQKSNGFALDVIDIRAWLGLAQLIFHGIRKVLWSRVWGGEGRGSLLLNSSLVRGSTGRLGNPPHVIDL